MAYSVRRAISVAADLGDIFDFLTDSYIGLGEPPVEAAARAEARIAAIETTLDALGAVPHQGTRWPAVHPRLRWVTKDRAIYYFVTDDPAATLTVLAVFFGGQDHRAQVLDRIRRRG